MSRQQIKNVRSMEALFSSVEAPYSGNDRLEHVYGILNLGWLVAPEVSLVAFRFSFREAPPAGLILRNDRDSMTAAG